MAARFPLASAVALVVAAGGVHRAGADPETGRGFAIGAALGEPTSVTARYAVLPQRLYVDAAIGSGVFGGTGLELHGGLTVAPVVLYQHDATVVPVYVGAGGHYYRHHYHAASVDELDDTHAGVYGVIGLGVGMKNHVEVYGEGGPGVDLSRSPSCSFISGTMTTCPHAMDSKAFVHVVVGLRYYFGG